MRVSGAGDQSPDGRQAVYSPLFLAFRTWKRYAGGWAQDLYRELTPTALSPDEEAQKVRVLH